MALFGGKESHDMYERLIRRMKPNLEAPDGLRITILPRRPHLQVAPLAPGLASLTRCDEHTSCPWSRGYRTEVKNGKVSARAFYCAQ